MLAEKIPITYLKIVVIIRLLLIYLNALVAESTRMFCGALDPKQVCSALAAPGTCMVWVLQGLLVCSTQPRDTAQSRHLTQIRLWLPHCAPAVPVYLARVCV